MNDCLFCKIIKGEIPATRVYETNDVFCFLDIKPLNPGHALLVPKAHHVDIFDMPGELLKTIGVEAKRVAKAIQEATGADGIGISQNNGTAAGQAIFHYHTHIIPRFLTDGYKSWKRTTDNPKEAASERLAEKIRTLLI